MAISTQIQNLNLIPGKSAPVVVHLSQGNVGNTVQFYLYDGDNPYYPTNVSIAVHGVRANNTVFGPYAVSVTSGSNLVSFTIVSAMTSVNGAAIGELVLTDSNQNQVGSANFGMLVEATPYSSSVTYEDDLSIYQRILSYVQSIPAGLQGQISTERTERIAADTAEKEARISSINDEANARGSAINAEASTRAAADANLQSQINQIVAPSGEAPSASEVQNARIGADGITYATLGDSIRSQVNTLINRTLALIPANKATNVTFVDDYYRYYNSGEIKRNTDFCYSSPIIVMPGTYYVLKGISASSHISFYDENMSYVSGVLSTNPYTWLTIPDNAIYMIASILKTEKGSLSLEWVDSRLMANEIVVNSTSQLADFDDAKWNRWYIIHFPIESNISGIENIPVRKNGVLITLGSSNINYAAKQIYIAENVQVYMRFYIPGTDSFTEWNASTDLPTGTLFDTPLTSDSTGEFSGTYTVVSNGFSVGGNLRLKRFYSIENRTATFLTEIPEGTVAGFGTRNYADYDDITCLLSVNIPDEIIKLEGFPAEPCSFLTGGHVYSVELGKHYQKLSIKVTDMNTGDVFEKDYINNGTGGAGEGAIGTANNVPMQYDYYFCQTISGSNIVLRRLTVHADPADVIFYGDSITEPENYWPTNLFDKTWTQMVIEESSKKCVTSGRSGSNIDQILERIDNELPYIGARYCVVTIGTNGGNTSANLTELVKKIKGYGAIPILNHIPCYDNNGNTTGFITINETINTVRNQFGIKGCDFDLPTSTNYDGQNVNRDMMWLETYQNGTQYYHHPNVKGSAAMLAQLKIDVPELF